MICARQVGKSTTAAFICLHRAICYPGSTCLIYSPSLRQSGEIFRKKVMKYYGDLGEPIPAVTSTQTMLELANGSRVLSLPGEPSTVRGFTGDLIVIDEAAMTSDDLWIAINPMLAVSQGRLVCLSTPMGAIGWFYNLFAGDDPSWHRTIVTARECPRIDPAFLREQETALGERYFSQEYLCEFVDAIGQVFGTDIIERAFKNDIQPLFG